MQIDKVPLKYLSPEDATKYKAIRKKYLKDYKSNQKLYSEMYKFCNIADVQAKKVLEKSYLGKYYRDSQGRRWVHITGARCEGVLECTIFQKQEGDITPAQDYFSITFNSSFGIDQLNRSEGSEKEWVGITKAYFEATLKAQLQKINKRELSAI
jgi:hypothetical protein